MLEQLAQLIAFKRRGKLSLDIGESKIKSGP